MKIINVEDISRSDLFYCYSGKLKKFLVEQKNINYIYKGFNLDKKTSFWVFIKTNKLLNCLTEWKINKEKGIKAVE